MEREVNLTRRRALQIIAAGVGMLAVSKLLGSGMTSLFASSGRGRTLRDPEKEAHFSNFRVAKNGRELEVYDGGGEKVLVIDTN